MAREHDQPLRRLFLTPRPSWGILGWLGAFVFLFAVFGTGKGERQPPPPPPPPVAQAAPAVPLPSLPPAPPARITVGLWQPPTGVFHPVLSGDPSDQAVAALLHEPLLAHGSDLRPIPNLASFSVAPDQQSVVLTLRPGLRWHDGTPVTARDVAFTLETVLRRDYRGPLAGRYQFIKGAAAFHDGKADAVSGVVVEGTDRVRVQLASPFGPALERLGALRLLPAHLLAGKTPEEMAAAVRAEPVGTGPFRLEAVAAAEGGMAAVELAAVPDFFRGRPAVDAVRFRVLTPGESAAQLLAEGVDLLEVRPEEAEAVAAAGYRLGEWPARGYHYLGLNMGRVALQDRRVRRALALALDKEAMARALYGGHATLMLAPVFPGSWAEAPGLDPYRYDPEQARALLAEAGWRDRDGDGVRERGGRPLSLALFYQRDDPRAEVLARLVRDALGAVGVEVEPEPRGRRELIRQVFGLRAFDLYLSDWTLDSDPDVSEVFGAGARVNAVGFRPGKEAQDLLRQAAALVEVERRQPLYHEWTRVANRELPYVFLFTPNRVVAMSPRLKGVRITPEGYLGGAEGWRSEP